MISQQRDPASFRDPSGFVFSRGKKEYFRQINNCYRLDHQHLVDSGLYARLVTEKLLLPHEEADLDLACEADAYKVVKPRPLSFVSYPYEWCFSQLQDAALTTLAIQKMALEYGMGLKDSNAFNIQYVDGRPLLIDLLSFQRLIPGSPWTAYRQFCEHFLAPLALAAYSDVSLNRLLCLYPGGVSLKLASSLLPWRSALRLPLYIHIHLHAKYQQRYADRKVNGHSPAMSINGLKGMIDSLSDAVASLRHKGAGAGWVNYYQDNTYTTEAWKHKIQIIDSYLEAIKPANVWDLGANTGEFSRLAGKRGITTVAFDNDHDVVENNYRLCKARAETNILPLVLDLTNPSPDIGWANRERKSILARGPADMALALALIHHLAIANNLPFEMIAAFLAQICRHLVVEFVPKNDAQVQRLLQNREDIFPRYTKSSFENAFARYFSIKDCTPISSSTRILYHMEVIHQ